MKKNIEIVMLGDSITGRGDWNTLLCKEHILNLGIEADTTLGILNRIDTVVDVSPNIVLFMAGINDFCTSIPIEKVFDNYKKVVQILKSENINIIVQSTLFTEMITINKKVKEFNDLVKNYCQEENLSYIDLNPIMSENEILKESYSTDGLHLNFRAYDIWAKEIKRVFF